jgi:hypothetical protein
VFGARLRLFFKADWSDIPSDHGFCPFNRI